MSVHNNVTRPDRAALRVADPVATAHEAIEGGVQMAKEEVHEVIARLQDRAEQA